MASYKGWELFDTMPEGYRIDPTAGSPLHGYKFINNGSILKGGKRALLRVKKEAVVFKSNYIDPELDDKQVQVIDAKYVRTVNELARQKFKQYILSEILTDMMICEIEGWCKMDYIREIREMINSIGKQSCIDGNNQIGLF